MTCRIHGGFRTRAHPAIRRRLLIPSLTLLAMASASALLAQQPLTRTVGGVVLDSVSGHPLSGVDVYFTTVAGQVRTGDDGRFRLEGSTYRDSVLVVRRIGFVPRTVVVTPLAGLLVLDVGAVYLRPVATQLDRIAVETEEVRRYPVLEGFYQRKAKLSGLGHFLTREHVMRAAALRTSDVLRTSHKLEIECSKVGHAQCLATSRRARETRILMRARDSLVTEDVETFFDAGRCRMEVWVDGVRSPFDLDAIPVDWIVGIEVYSGPATTPPVFGMGPCGVVAIWTVAAGK